MTWRALADPFISAAQATCSLRCRSLPAFVSVLNNSAVFLPYSTEV